MSHVACFVIFIPVTADGVSAAQLPQVYVMRGKVQMRPQNQFNEQHEREICERYLRHAINFTLDLTVVLRFCWNASSVDFA